MDLAQNDIDEFIRLWKREFKETLSVEDARHNASQLLELFAVLVQPLPADRSSVENPPRPPCDTSSTAENQAKTKTDR